MALVRAAQGTSSDSNTRRGYRYDVFLSFRGEDTRRTFTDHLYTALNNAGFLTFRDDDELERGEDIKQGLQKAIRLSRTSVVVFSKSYASSKWCLDELVMILERKRTTSDHVLLPVFYDVDPSHVRKQTGSIGKAFARHEKTQLPNTVKRWREALAEVADLAGMVLPNEADGYESKFITKIVKVIGDKLIRTPLSVESNLVGIQFRVKHINLWLQDGSTDVGIVVLYGMSGIGKTTFAKYVYNSNFTSFEGSSFVENIREKANQPNGLVQIQMQLLYDILKGKEEKVHNVSEGISKIERAISSRRVLLVLDDVDHMDQLDAVLRMKDQFYPGSKIIITTRRKRLLKAHQVTKVHEVETLDYDESLELLSWHAFGQDHPCEGYMEYSKELVQHSGGLPLALQVLGSSLLGESMDVWKSALEKLKVIPNDEIMKKLRISYDNLQDDHDRKLFLHIACFLIGRDKNYIVRILDGCDFYTTVGIQNLIDRCLVKIEDNKVNMHDLIRDMGRDMVRLESEEPGKRSRLWRHKDSFEVLRDKNGTETIQGLVLDMHGHPANSPINTNETIFETNAFERMHKLQILHLRCVRLEGCYADFPTGLRWLRWLEFPLDSIPIDFPLECLIVLEMQYSRLREVYKGTKFLPSLKILDVSHSHGLSKTMDFSYCPNLEELILVDCGSLLDVHESIGNLERLVCLNLKDCKNLRMLPKNMCMLKSLETLILSGCSNLGEMKKKMESLKMLKTDGIPRSELWPGRSSSILTYLPCSLVELRLRSCNLSDDAFATDLSNLSSLQTLYLDDNPICSLPVFIKGLTKLEVLSFNYCKRLESLVGLPKTERVHVRGCTSLKKVTYQSYGLRALTYSRESENHNVIEYEYYDNLEKIERVDVEMRKLFSLHNLEMRKIFSLQNFKQVDWVWSPVQGLDQHGIYSTFFAGNEAPDQFSYKSTNSSISFIVPSLSSHKIRGLNIFATYANKDWNWMYSPHPCMSIEVSNKSKGMKWIYGPRFYRHRFGREGGEDTTWLSHWKMDNQTIILECGDEVVVSVMTNPCEIFRVKEFGVELVQEHQDKMSTQHNTTPDPNDPFVIGGDLSPPENVSGTYYFCWFSETEMQNVGFCRPKWLNTLIMDSDKEEEQQNDPDHKIAAATARGNNCHLGGWRGLVTAAVFFLTLTLIFLPSLKILDVSHSHGLSKTMDFSYCPNLEELILVDCGSLLDVHESIGNLESLMYLNLMDCKNLRMLPKNMCMLKSLETLILSGCSNLDEMMKKMESLKMLETDGIPRSEIWPGRSSSILTYLPCSLVELRLRSCNLSDDTFATDLSNLSSLQRLYLGDNPICSLPVFIKGLTKLESLSFDYCKRLESLVGLPKTRSVYVHGCTSLKKVTYQSYGLRALTYTGENHNVIECEYYDNLEQIERVDVEMRKLFSLHNLEMRKLFSLQNFKQVDWVWSPVQGLDQHGIYSTFFAGNEVPGRFSYKSTNSSISFIVPSLSSHKIRGLNIFATYAHEDYNWACSPHPRMSIEVSNKSKGMKWTYGPRFTRHRFGREGGEDTTWLSHWKMDNQTIILECGDEVVVSVMTRGTYEFFRVKEFGVELVQEHQDKMSTQHNTAPDPNDPFVIGGDLSPLEHVSGTYHFHWFSEAEMKNVDFCRPKWLNALIMDSDKEEEQQNDPDHKIAAATARGNNCHLGGWRGLITAAVFLLTLTLIVRPSRSQKKKRQ